MTEEEYFRKNYPDSCYGDKPLSPHWDFFQDGVEFGERQSEKRIEELEATNKTISNECHKLVNSLEKKQNEVAELKSELTKKADTNHSLVEQMADLESKNAELEKKNTALRQDWEIMKNTIADYNDFCDKYIKLEKENAELKEKLAGAERARDNLRQIGFPTFQSCKEYADKLNYVKAIIKDLLKEE